MTTWDPANKSPSVTLSNGNLTASATSIADKAVKSTTTRNSGIFAWELKVNAAAPAFGICNSAASNTTDGSGGTSYVVFQNGTQVSCVSAGVNIVGTSFTGTIAVNDVWTMIVDYPNLRFYVLQNGTNRLGTNFAARTGGIAITAGTAWFAWWLSQNHTPDTGTASFSSLVNLPSGATEWDAPTVITGVGTATGSSTVAGVGSSTSIGTGVGTAAGTSAVAATSAASKTSVGTAAGTGTAAASSTRLATRPFSNASSWNTLVPAGSTFTALPWPASTGFNYGVAWDSFSPPVYVSVASDPLVAVTHPDTWGTPAGTVNVRMPLVADGAAGTDKELIVIDGDIVHNFWNFVRTDSTHATAGAYAAANFVTGTGWGTASPFLGAGTTAAGASELAGLLVEAEIVADGVISHAVHLATDFAYTKSGFTGEAIAGDGSGNVGSFVQEGQFLAIPPATSMPGGLSSLGQKVFTAYKNYGAYVIDVAGGTTNIRAQANAFDDPTITALQLDLLVITPLLQAVGAPAAGSIGTAAGTSTVAAVGRAIRPLVGTAGGTATAAAVGVSTVAGVGTAAGTSSAAGIGAASSSAVGTAAATSTAVGVGASRATGVGLAAGSGVAAGVGASSATGTAIGSSAGLATVAGVTAAQASSVGTAAGTSVAAAIAPTRGVGTATGTSSAASVGVSTAAAIGTSAGSSTAAGTTATTATIASVGTTSGTSTVAAIGIRSLVAAGTAGGTSTAAATGRAIVPSLGAVAGLGTGIGVGASLATAIGSTAGSSTVAGTSGTIKSSVGIAAGSSIVLGVGKARLLRAPELIIEGAVVSVAKMRGSIAAPVTITGQLH